MVFYHGTSKANWKKIKKENCLYGIRNASSRCTYLALEKKVAECYGKVVLEVSYNPFKHSKKNNFIVGCWQIRVYEKIKLNLIRKLNDK